MRPEIFRSKQRSPPPASVSSNVHVERLRYGSALRTDFLRERQLALLLTDREHDTPPPISQTRRARARPNLFGEPTLRVHVPACRANCVAQKKSCRGRPQCCLLCEGHFFSNQFSSVWWHFAVRIDMSVELLYCMKRTRYTVVVVELNSPRLCFFVCTTLYDLLLIC